MKTIMKTWLINILIFMSFTSIANADGLTPYYETSTVYFDRLEVKGSETLEVSLTLKDLFFDPVTDAHPTFELNSSDGTPVDINLTSTSQSGNIYTFIYQTDTTTRDQNIIFTPVGNYNDSNPWRFDNLAETVLFRAGSYNVTREISPTYSTILASPTEVTANGVETSTITVTLRDIDNGLVDNAVLTPEQNGSSTISNVTNHQDGNYTFTVTSTTVETVNYGVNATSPNNSVIIGDTTVNFTPITLGDATTVSAAPLRVEADGIDTSVITMTLLDANDTPISNARVSLSADVNTSTISDVDNARKDEGIYTFTVSSSTIGDVTYTASYFDQVLDDKKVTVTYWNKADATKGSVVANPTEVVNNGTDTSTITVTVLDALDKPVTDANVSLAGNPSTSNISSVDNTQSASGVYVFTVSSEHKGAVVYTATATVKDSDGNDVDIVLDDTATVNYTNTNPDNMTITLTPSEQTTIVGVDASIVASVKIANTNVVQVGVTVSLDGGDIGASTATTCVTEDDGTCTITVHDEKAETIVYIPKANGQIPEGSSTTASVTFKNPPSSDIVIALSPSEQNTTVGIATSIVATVTRQGTNIPLKGVTVSLDGGDIGTSTATTCTTEADGTCTNEVNDTKVETIVYVPKANGETPHEESTTSSVTYTTGTSIKVISITPVSHTMQAGDTVTMSIQTQDTLGNAKDPSNLDLIASIDDINISTCVKIELGKHTCDVTSTVTGEYTLTTKVADAPDQLEASLTVTPSSGTFVTLTADPEETEVVGNNVTITMTLKDDYDNLKDVEGAEENITSEPSNATLTGGHESLGVYTYTLYDEKTETVTIETNVAGADENQNVSIVFTPGPLDFDNTIVKYPVNEIHTFEELSLGIYTRDKFGNSIPLPFLEDNTTLYATCKITDTNETNNIGMSVTNSPKIGIGVISRIYATTLKEFSCQYSYQGTPIQNPYIFTPKYGVYQGKIRTSVNDYNDSAEFNSTLVLANAIKFGHTNYIEIKVFDYDRDLGDEVDVYEKNVTIRFYDGDTGDIEDGIEMIGDIEFDETKGRNYMRFKVYYSSSASANITTKAEIDGHEASF